MSQGYTLVRGLEVESWRERKTVVEATAVRREERPRRNAAAWRPGLLHALADSYGAALLKTFERLS